MDRNGPILLVADLTGSRPISLGQSSTLFASNLQNLRCGFEKMSRLRLSPHLFRRLLEYHKLLRNVLSPERSLIPFPNPSSLFESQSGVAMQFSFRRTRSLVSYIASIGFTMTVLSNSLLAQEAAASKNENLLVKTWNSLGPMYAVIFLIISMVLVALVVRTILAVQKNNFIPDDLIQGVEASLTEKNAQAAVELVRADESFLGQVLSAGLGKLQKGKEPAMEAMQIVGESETMRIEHLLSYLALIGNICPMIGLLGTVQGMVASFGKIAGSETTPKPSELAGGIEQALYTTLFGLFLAIPAITIYNILRNRVQRMIMNAGTISEEMLEKFQSFVKV